MWELIKDPKVLVAIGTTIIAIILAEGLIKMDTNHLSDIKSTLDSQVEVQRQMTKVLESNTEVTRQFQDLLLRVVGGENKFK